MLNSEVDYCCCQVLECCWADLKKQVREASDLDHIIAAHETFLDQVLNRCLLDAESRVSKGALLYLYSKQFSFDCRKLFRNCFGFVLLRFVIG